MEKSKLLYGLHLALSMTGPVWICEGLTDCWKVGPGATAVFGKTLSSFQKQLLVYHFVSRPIVLLLDSDAHKEADEICQQLQRARGLSEGDRRVVVADLPAGRNDPAECTQEEIVQATDRALGYQW
jgi:DNA primase